MTVDYGATPPQPSDPDLSREQVVALFRDRDNDALKRHTGLVGTDGTGSGLLYVICGCELQFGFEEWGVHLRAVVQSQRRFRPTKR